MSRLILSIFILVQGLLAVPFLRATDPGRLQVGDSVFVLCPQTEFKLDNDETISLSGGDELRVVEVSKNVVRAEVRLETGLQTGWVPAAKVHKPDDLICVGALEKIEGIQLYKDRMGAIARIDAKRQPFGDELKLLNGLYNLETLELSGAKLTNSDLDHLQDLTNLRWLYLDDTSVNDEGLLSLRRLVNLEVLVLSHSAVEGPGLVYLRNLRCLRVLNLSDCRIRDESFTHLGKLSHLETLALENTPIRGQGFAYLQTMPRLNVLNLNGCNLEPGAILQLKTSADLRILRARGATIPESDIKELLTANPRLFICN